jgi:hypothetical protein
VIEGQKPRESLSFSARRGGLGPRIAPACWRSKPSSRLCQVYVFGTRKGCRLGKDSWLIQTSIPARSPAVMHGIRHAGRGNGHDHEGTDGLHDSPLERVDSNHRYLQDKLPLRDGHLTVPLAERDSFLFAAGNGYDEAAVRDAEAKVCSFPAAHLGSAQIVISAGRVWSRCRRRGRPFRRRSSRRRCA